MFKCVYNNKTMYSTTLVMNTNDAEVYLTFKQHHRIHTLNETFPFGNNNEFGNLFRNDHMFISMHIMYLHN